MSEFLRKYPSAGSFSIPSHTLKLLIAVVIPLFGIMAGLAASTGDLRIVAFAAAGIVGIVIAMSPQLLLWITLVVAILVAGTTQIYLPQLQLVRWFPPLGAWLLTGYAVANLYMSHVSARQPVRLPVPTVIWWAIAVMVVLLISSLLHWPGSDAFIKGTKGYFQVWGLIFALAFYPWSEQTIRRLPWFFLLAAMLQLPFVLHQYLVLVPARGALRGEGVVAVDIIAGTFGGQASGGGNNAALSTFLMIVFAGLLSAWRQGVMPLRHALLLGLPLMVPIVLNVSKVSIIYAAVTFLVLFGKDAMRSPKQFTLGLMLFLGIMAALATAYTAFAPQELDSWEDLYEFTYEGNVANDLNSEGELTRGGSIRYWLERQATSSWAETLFGYGPGVTRSEEDGEDSSSFVLGPIDPSLKVGRIAVTAMLWEGGLLTLICVFGMFYSAYVTAGRLAKACTEDAMRRAMFLACQAAIAVLFVALWHKHFFVFLAGFQTVFVVIVGYLAYWVRHPDSPNSKLAGND